MLQLLLPLNTDYAGHAACVGSAQSHNLGWAPLQNLTSNPGKNSSLSPGIAQSSTVLRGKIHLCCITSFCLRCFYAVSQEALTSLGCEAGEQLLWGLKQRQVWHFRRKVKGGKERLVLSLCMSIRNIADLFWKVYHSGFYLTLHHTTGKLQENHALWWCAWSFFRKMGK